jgi:predicted Rossmann fold flavoprotein
MLPQHTYDAVIAGGGAAGLFCALTAGRRGRRVAVLERGERPGRKVIISGGGRCNFTNLNASAEHYLSANPDFAISALSRFTPADFIALVESHAIAYHEKELGQLFCDGTSQAVLDMLLAECAAVGVELLTGVDITAVAPQAGGWTVRTGAGEFHADALVLATGGLSIPKMGSTGFAYEVAREQGLEVVPTRAGLVPFTFPPDETAFFKALAGVSVPCAVTAGGRTYRHNLLCTHRGLSGPAMLQASSHWLPGQAITVDLAPGVDIVPRLEGTRSRAPRVSLGEALAGTLPRRFAEAFAAAYLPAGPLGRLSNQALEETAALLHGWALRPAGTEGYRTAEVTVGGVDTRGLSSRTMESRAPGLFCIGECVDVTGELGGYNFQWAWASAHAAGEAL